MLDPRTVLNQLMEQGRSQVEREIEAEQITHPVHLYQPGSERLEKLYQAMETANRFSWPTNGFEVNL